MTNAIALSGIVKSFGNLVAVDHINLYIEEGEFFGLLGPNGAGKSTLINIVAGLVRANSGEVLIHGYDVTAEYRQARQCLGVVPQELVFDPFFTVRELLQIQSGYFGLGKENSSWIDELLEKLDLSEKANVNMRALSGGMKRRVLIAQALVHKPRVVVLDEPTAGVDIELRKQLWLFVKSLHQEGHTIVLTTHYLEEAEALCDRIAILNHGKLMALDSKQALLDCDIGMKQRLGVTTRQAVISVPDSINAMVKHQHENYLEVELSRDKDSIIDILDKLRDAGADIMDLKTERADLEDVFVEIINRKQD
ncbi:MAG: ABC transporter ATP-binding protein [Gammaproteobacteria bacterium]